MIGVSSIVWVLVCERDELQKACSEDGPAPLSHSRAEEGARG